MRAIVVEANGGPEVLQLRDRPDPVPGPGEVLVEVANAGVNFADIVMRRGLGRTAPPFVPGVEGAGVIAGLGEGVVGFTVGQRVAWSPVARAGGVGSYAELECVAVEQLLPVPDDVSLDVAGAMTLQGLTAHYLVHDICRLDGDSVVLVHAGAGGTGRLVVQWLAHRGATVLATVGSEEKAEVARAAGASHTILYSRTDFADAALELTGGRGVDYVVDGVVGGTFAGDLRAVAPRGHVCVFGRAGGEPEPFSPLALMAKSISVTGGFMSNFLRDADEVRRRAEDLWAGLGAGWLSPLVHSVHPLADAAEAHRLLEGRGTVGKVMLTI